MRSEYEIFESSSDTNRRLLRQEELILEVTEALSEALEQQRVTKAALAARLGRSKAFVTQILAGGRNLTLRTLADVADALGCEVRVQAKRLAEDGPPLTARNTTQYTVEHPGTWGRVLVGKFAQPAAPRGVAGGQRISA